MNISQIMEKMIAFSNGNLHDMNHLMCVWTYAKTIGELEGLDLEDPGNSGDRPPSPMTSPAPCAGKNTAILTASGRRKRAAPWYGAFWRMRACPGIRWRG